MLPESVMIVEDEIITARYIAGQVTKIGIRVTGIYNSADTVMAALADDAPELVLMDVNIKGNRDGFELSELIWQHKKVPVIYITAYCDNQTLQQAFKPLSYGYVVKPFSPIDLEEVLKRAYGQYARQTKIEERPNDTMLKLSPVHSFETDSARLYRNDEEVALSHNQRLLLSILVKNLNNVLSNVTLEYAIWKDEDISLSTMRTLIYSLRKVAPELQIKTHSKSGYSLHL